MGAPKAATRVPTGTAARGATLGQAVQPRDRGSAVRASLRKASCATTANVAAGHRLAQARCAREACGARTSGVAARARSGRALRVLFQCADPVRLGGVGVELSRLLWRDVELVGNGMRSAGERLDARVHEGGPGALSGLCAGERRRNRDFVDVATAREGHGRQAVSPRLAAAALR